MARAPREYREMHAAADKIERRLAPALLRAFDRSRAGTSINAMAQVLHRAQLKWLMSGRVDPKDVAAVMALVGDVSDALSPAGSIVADAFERGRKLGRAQMKGPAS